MDDDNQELGALLRMESGNDDPITLAEMREFMTALSVVVERIEDVSAGLESVSRALESCSDDAAILRHRVAELEDRAR